jgi:hypothetical protein
MYYYTYLSIDKIDNRMYIGSRGCKCPPSEDVLYYGSFKDKTFKPTIKKILKQFKTRKEAFNHEIYLHFILDVAINPNFANRCRATTTGFTWAGQKHTPETIEKIKKSSKLSFLNMSDETKINRRKKLKSKTLTKEHREKLKRVNTGKPKSPETREKIRQKAFNRTVSQQTRLKLSRNSKGRWLNRLDQSKPITLVNITTKEIKTFASQKEAVRCLNLQQASVNRVALGKQYSCRGWILHSI